MGNPIQSLIKTGTKLWLDSVDPDLVIQNRHWGATGATSNPLIIGDLIQSGRFDDRLRKLMEKGFDDGEIAWRMTDYLVSMAQQAFLPDWERSSANDGYVSFELDPLLEDPKNKMPIAERTRQYIALGKKWSAGHRNRMIKVPATEAGVGALAELAAAGVTLNITLIFTPRQYQAARDAVWQGAQRRTTCDSFKSVYSNFVSRVDVYTQKHVPELSPAAQGMTGIVNAKRIWQENQQFWSGKNLTLQQEIIFASTGTKLATDAPWKYVEAFAGSDIETNPPATNDAVNAGDITFSRKIDQMPPQSVLDEIDQKVDLAEMERVLLDEGIAKFADPHYQLLKSIARKRQELAVNA